MKLPDDRGITIAAVDILVIIYKKKIELINALSDNISVKISPLFAIQLVPV